MSDKSEIINKTVFQFLQHSYSASNAARQYSWADVVVANDSIMVGVWWVQLL